MIDFRYHLVSIVSIFLALAVGIVLGAGPLKEDLGNTLTQQLNQLREDKSELRSQLDAEQRATDAGDAFASLVGPALTRDALAGRSVAVIQMPGADSDLAKSVADTLTAAGAQIGATLTLTESWADPAKRTFRNDLAGQLASLVKTGPGATNADQLPATVLARSILGGTDQSTDRLDPGASQALDGLKAGDLVQVATEDVQPSSSAVLVGGPLDGSDPQDVLARTDTYVLLAQALDAAGSGTVAVTSTNPADARISTGVVAAIRADDDAVKVVSTVDDADLAMGRTTLVLALTREYAALSGRYGVASDAAAVVPDIGATAAPTTP